MSIISKILFGTISIAILSLLLISTYISNNPTEFEKPYFQETKLGLFILKKESGLLRLRKFTGSGTNEIFINKINFTDNILYHTGSINYDETSSGVNISIKSGLYLFDLNESNKNYIIKSKGFKASIKGPGIFFINNINPKKNIIYSLSTIIELDLIDIKSNELLTKIDLYPNMYLNFNIHRIKDIFIKNADLLKISKTFKLEYFQDKIFKNNEVNKSFINLLSLGNDKYFDFINKSIGFIKQDIDLNTNIINNFLNKQIGTIPGEELILKYSSIFINKNKKSSYYKNIIIKKFHDLLKSKKIDDEIINDIQLYLNKLKNIDNEGSDEVMMMLNFYYNHIVKTTSPSIQKLNIAKLLNELNGQKYLFKLESTLFLENIFLIYNFSGENDIYYGIGEFRKKYFENLNLNIDTEIKSIEKLDYLLYFLEKILTSNLANSGISIKDLNIIFEDYNKISKYIYSSYNEKNNRIGLLVNEKILKKIIEILESKFFETKRNENGLLILKEKNNITRNEIKSLEKNSLILIEYYEKYRYILDENNKSDQVTIRTYTEINKKNTEYFTALKNYKNYSIEYDNSKNRLLQESTINEIDKEIILSTENAINYLSQFQGLSNLNLVINIKNYNYCMNPEESIEDESFPYCYEIKNLLLNSLNISFLLHPYNKNNINYIIINGERKNYSFLLDEIKKELKEKERNNISKDNKTKYSFEYFFINTFYKERKSNQITIIKKDPIFSLEEDDTVKFFKRNKLFGEYGDFINLKGFLNIKYNDLLVKRIGEKYLIEIKTAKLYKSIDKENKYYGTFSSKYNFSEKHSFINPNILFHDKKAKKYLLIGNNIYINGEYKVNSLEKELDPLFNTLKSTDFIVNSVYSKFNNKNIIISFDKKSQNTTINLDNKGKILSLLLKKGKIFEANYNGENILKKVVSYLSIDNILNDITN